MRVNLRNNNLIHIHNECEHIIGLSSREGRKLKFSRNKGGKEKKKKKKK